MVGTAIRAGEVKVDLRRAAWTSSVSLPRYFLSSWSDIPGKASFKNFVFSPTINSSFQRVSSVAESCNPKTAIDADVCLEGW